MNLSQSQFQSAANYIKTRALPVEQALFTWAFEKGSTDEVLEALATHQAEDGGYVQLEPDAVVQESTVLDTTRAFQVHRRIGTPLDHPQIQAGIRYLMDTFDEKRHIWPIRASTSPDQPGAPWWQADDLASLIERFGGCKGNPTPEVIGYLRDYPTEIDPDFIDTLESEAVEHLMSQPHEMDAHDLHCFIHFSETRTLDEAVRQQVIEKLQKILAATVTTDPSLWNGYCLRPLWVIEHPDSPLLVGIDPDLVERNIQHKIRGQNENGSWGPTWEWGQFPELWEEARRAWASSPSEISSCSETSDESMDILDVYRERLHLSLG